MFLQLFYSELYLTVMGLVRPLQYCISKRALIPFRHYATHGLKNHDVAQRTTNCYVTAKCIY